MKKDKLRATLRVLLAVIVLFLCAGLSPAQNNGNANTNGQSKPTATPGGCQKGQMRCTNNKDRWAAAARHANRRADHIRKNHGKVSK